MANTYTQIYIHAVFAVKYRQAIIPKSISQGLYQYIGGIIRNEGQVPLKINGMPDHIHLLFRIKPSANISVLMCQIKANSSRWLNQQGILPHKFAWQRGYGAFSVDHSRIPQLRRYIENQEFHHKNTSFKNEYVAILNTQGIEYEEHYLFEWIY